MSRPRLDVLSGDLTGRSYVVDEDEFVIGRGRNCDLVIPKRYISREHARIVRGRQGFVIDGLSAKNPVVVSNRPVREHPLTDGDVFEMCGIQFRFSIPRPGEAARQASTIESQSGIGWRDEDTEAGFKGKEQRDKKKRKSSSKKREDVDSWDAPAPPPRKKKRSKEHETSWRDEQPADDWQDEGKGDAGWEDEPAPAKGKADSWEDAPAPAKGKADSWEDAPAPAKGKADSWEDAPRPKGKADSWSDDDQPAARAKKKDAWDDAPAKSPEDSWSKDDDSWADEGPKPKGGERRSGIVFEVEDAGDANDQTGALSAKKLRELSSRGSGSGVRESDSERTAELGKQLDPDDPDYDPFAQLDNERPKEKQVDPNREKVLRAMSLVGLVGLFLAYIIFKQVTKPLPYVLSEHSPPVQTYVGGSVLLEVTWQTRDRPRTPGNIPVADLTGNPEEDELLLNDGTARVEWLLPKLERSLFLIKGLNDGTTSFTLEYPESRRKVTYIIEVSGEDPHAQARDKRQKDYRGGKFPARELSSQMKDSWERAETFKKGRTLSKKEGFYRKAVLEYGNALDLAEALGAAEGRSGGRTKATEDWIKKCRKAEQVATEEWEERLSRDLARYRNLVHDGNASVNDRREQLKSVLRLISHPCDLRYRRLETILQIEYASTLTERERCEHE